MALVALVVALFVLPYLAFNVGGTVPGTGMGDVLGPAPTAPAAGRATLTLRGLRPVTVAGSGFKPGEIVRITGVEPRRVRASAGGRFLVRLGRSAPCANLSIEARGSKGSRAVLQFSELLCVEP